jgi:hypothetical protein
MADSTSVDYALVLADLRAKRVQIDAAISGVEAMLGLKSSAPPADAADTTETPETHASGGSTLGPGAFLGMSIVDAAKKLLAHRRQNLKTEEILRALRDGGIVLSGKEPLNVVGSVLNRNFSAGGEIVKVSRGVWGLASWHPRLRRKVADGKNPTAVDETPADTENTPTDEDQQL